jgi:hypothetical protein
VDGQPPERETPHPSQLGGEKGNGAEVSTGHTVGVSGVDSTVSIREFRARRYSTQRAIALICRADAKRLGVTFPGDRYRVIDCMWCRIGEVSVQQSMNTTALTTRGFRLADRFGYVRSAHRRLKNGGAVKSSACSIGRREKCSIRH